MERISIKAIEARVAYLNQITGNPPAPYTKRPDGTYAANIGNYHVSQAYGGVMVQQMHNDAGGVNTPFMVGHVTRRECFDALNNFIRGFEAGRDRANRAEG